MNWLHIIADLKEINFNRYIFDEKILKKFFSEIITKNNLTEMWNFYKTFTNKNEITGVIALAESHISFHTFPEFKSISLDIFVCNLKQDNSKNAEKIFEEILEFFDCKKYNLQKIKRDFL